MKKLLIAGNCLFFSIAVVLGVLLYQSETRQSAKAVGIVQQIQSPTLVPAVTPTLTPLMPTPDARMLKESYYQPFGELTLPILQQYAEYGVNKPQLSLHAENPIDTAFAPYWGRGKSTSEYNVLAGQYRDCWEAEALHALELLTKQANPIAEHIPEMTREIRDSMLGFADITGELYANIYRTDVFLYEGTTPVKAISIGTAYPGTMSSSSAAFLRSYTFYLYDLLASMNVQPDFVFDAKAVHEEWDYLLE